MDAVVNSYSRNLRMQLSAMHAIVANAEYQGGTIVSHAADSGTTTVSRVNQEEDFRLERQMDALFRAVGARPPLVVWNPEPDRITHPIVRAFGAKCRMRADPDGSVPADAFSIQDFGLMSQWALLLDVETPTGPFRYCHYGSRIADHFGRDMTGETSDAFGGHISEYFSLLYSEVVARGEWLLSEHEPPAEVFVRSWQRLIVPLFDDTGHVRRIAVANVAENELRAGLDLIVDPVFVLDRDQTILYANPAAQRFFRVSPKAIAPAHLHDMTGISLDGILTPDQMLARGEVMDRIELTNRGGLIERLALTVSAAQHRGRAYHVAIMRVIGT